MLGIQYANQSHEAGKAGKTSGAALRKLRKQKKAEEALNVADRHLPSSFQEHLAPSSYHCCVSGMPTATHPISKSVIAMGVGAVRTYSQPESQPHKGTQLTISTHYH